MKQTPSFIVDKRSTYIKIKRLNSRKMNYKRR
jgi:hypothetical protein